MTVSRAQQAAELRRFNEVLDRRHMDQLRQMLRLTGNVKARLSIDRVSRERARQNHLALAWAIERLEFTDPTLKEHQ